MMTSTEVRAFAEQVAKFMPGWHAASAGELGDMVDGTVSKITRLADKACVLVSLVGDGDRFELCAGWPKYKSGERYHPDEILSITVATKRTAEAVASEIERRLLPKYLPAYAKALTNITARDTEQAAMQACAGRLAALVGASAGENGRGGYGLYGATPECVLKVSVKTRGTSLELIDLDEVTAARILTLLKQREEAATREEASNETSEQTGSKTASATERSDGEEVVS